MKAGADRHKELEKEVVERIKAKCKSKKDKWAAKLVEIIIGVNRLYKKGLTRELRVIAFVHGVWITGVIDEIRLSSGENRNPVLVDFKTRKENSQPFEPQKRNGRLQLMIYKLLWDHLVSGKFPSEKFFDFFQLNRDVILSEEVRTSIADAGVPAQTLGNVVQYLEYKCSMLPSADNKIILRYEWQKNKCLIGEVEFEYEPVWLKAQLEDSLGFWVYEKEASYAPLEEHRKCLLCKYGPGSCEYENQARRVYY